MKLSERTTTLLATFFYVGKFPIAPGTLASFAGMLLAITFYRCPLGYTVLTAVITIIGFKVSGQLETILNKKDPSCVVIDEVAGVLIAFFILPLTPTIIIVTFFLFRAFDMFKIYPVNKFEEMKGSAGIMMDDLIAGVYTNLIMQLAIRWAKLIS